MNEPLRQIRYAEGFGTLFTAEYLPRKKEMVLHWQGQSWSQSLGNFAEGQRVISYDEGVVHTPGPYSIDWAEIGRSYARSDQVDWRQFVPDYITAA